jgi:hypothetical protein
MSSTRACRTTWLATLFVFPAACVCVPALCQAAVQSEIDRTTVSTNEPLTLNIVSDSPQSGAQPDLSPLRKDFSLLGSDVARETSIVDGTRSDRVHWTIRLMPLHAGAIEIPSLAVGSDRTASIDVTVSPPSPTALAEAATHAFLEIDTIPPGQSSFVQQSIPYTVRLFVDGTVQGGALDAPQSADAAIEQVGQDKRYTTRRHGHDYNVIERRYVISPEKSGTLTITPPTFQGTAVIPASSSSDATTDDDDPAADMMSRMLRGSPFANDPMLRGGMLARLGAPQETRPLTAQAPGLKLAVKPRPAAAQGNWFPAQGVILHDSWQDAAPQFHVGEPVTRVITIEARGAAGSQIPTLAPDAPANVRLYPESADNQTRIDGDEVVGVSQQKITYIPSAPGPLDSPSVHLAWWDTTAGVQRTETLPAIQFTVAPGSVGASAVQKPEQGVPDAARATGTASAESGGDGPAAATASRLLRADWRWLAGSLAALAALAAVIVAALAARRSRIRNRPGASLPTETPSPASTTTPRPGKKAALRTLREACSSNDRRAAAGALLDLARLEWPEDPPRGLSALAARVRDGAAEITALDRSLYREPDSTWNGEALARAIGAGLRRSSSADASDPLGLDSLYRSDPAAM